MAIRIIKEVETLTATIEGAKFTYRRLPANRRARITEAHTSKRSGVVNWSDAALAYLEYSLIDWEGVVDEKGNPIPFDKTIIPYLPDTVQGDLVDRLGENVPADAPVPKIADEEKRTDELKNS